jgi:hypothetical protein
MSVQCTTLPNLDLDIHQLLLTVLHVTQHLHEGDSPHDMTESVNCWKWVLCMVMSNTTTHYSGLYIIKLRITERTAQICGYTRFWWQYYGGWAELVPGRRPTDRDSILKHCFPVFIGFDNCEFKKPVTLFEPNNRLSSLVLTQCNIKTVTLPQINVSYKGILFVLII